MPCRGLPVYGGVEGALDQALLERLLSHLGLVPGSIIQCGGKATLQQRLPAFSGSARNLPWLVLADLDTDAACAPQLRRTWLPKPARCMCLRFAVRQAESWLMADAERCAAAFRVALSRVPEAPESLPDAKGALVELVRHSRSSAIREDMVPRPSSGRRVGPAYTSRVIEYVANTAMGWRPDVAADVAPSLAATIAGIQRLVGSR